MRHVSNMNVLRRKYECDTNRSRIAASLSQSKKKKILILLHRTFERIMSHLQMRHVALTNASCCAYERSCCAYKCVMWHVSMSSAAHMKASCCTYECVVFRMCHFSHINASCRTYECVMLHIWMSHVTHLNESCHILQMCDIMSRVRRHTLEWVLSHIRTREMISHIWMPDSFKCVSSYARHDVTCMYGSCHTCEWVMSRVRRHIWTPHVTRTNE